MWKEWLGTCQWIRGLRLLDDQGSWLSYIIRDSRLKRANIRPLSPNNPVLNFVKVVSIRKGWSRFTIYIIQT
jgi:hypothetical protein